MKAIGYVRVSTDKQAEDGVSVDAQEVKLRQYAALYGIELVGVVIDAGASAKTLDRPGLQEALSYLTAGKADGMIVAKLDRLTRSVRDLDTLITEYFRDRFNLVSVSEQIDTSTAAGRLVLNVLMSVAQWEREAIGERTATAMQHKKSIGERVGSVPYGYRVAEDGVRLLEDEAEQEILQVAARARRNGLSLRKIAARLESKGFTNRAGRPFHPNTVASIIRSV